MARDVVGFLQGHRHAVQGSELLAGLHRPVGRLGPLARALDVHGDDRVELGVMGRDTLEVEIEQLQAADLLLPDRRGELLAVWKGSVLDMLRRSILCGPP